MTDMTEPDQQTHTRITLTTDRAVLMLKMLGDEGKGIAKFFAALAAVLVTGKTIPDTTRELAKWGIVAEVEELTESEEEAA